MKGGSVLKLVAASILLLLLFGVAVLGISALDNTLDDEIEAEYFEENESESESGAEEMFMNLEEPGKNIKGPEAS